MKRINNWTALINYLFLVSSHQRLILSSILSFALSFILSRALSRSRFPKIALHHPAKVYRIRIVTADPCQRPMADPIAHIHTELRRLRVIPFQPRESYSYVFVNNTLQRSAVYEASRTRKRSALSRTVPGGGNEFIVRVRGDRGERGLKRAAERQVYPGQGRGGQGDWVEGEWRLATILSWVVKNRGRSTGAIVNKDFTRASGNVSVSPLT